MIGTVVEVHGIKATVLLHADQRRLRCRPLRDRTRLAVGDRVEAEEGKDGPTIVRLEPRERCLWRPKERGRQLMAAHVDRVIVVSALDPPPRAGLLDRFIVASSANDIDVAIILNKVDLDGLSAARAVLRPYVDLGYPVLETSAATGEGLDALDALVERGLSVFAGHSGVGKSSILNRVVPEAALDTAALSGSSGKGRHTTSVTTCHLVGGAWPDAALLVDTPGVRAFGLHGIEPARIAHGYRELRPLVDGCRFRDCLHVEEPGCAVREAAEAGDVDPERYAGYLRIMASVRAGEG